MRPLSLVALLALTLSLTAADFPPAGFTRLSSTLSSGGNFRIIHFKQDPQDFSSESQIWVESLRPAVPTQLLFTHHNRATWVLSDDDAHIAINYHMGSTEEFLHVYLRDEAGHFHQLKEDFEENAQKQLLRQLKLQKFPDFDHLYCNADTWLRDGYLLGHLVGHGASDRTYLDEWYFIYDTRHDRYLWNLAEMNQHALQHPKPR